MLGEPLLAGQLRDLRAVWRHIQRRSGDAKRELAVLADSGAAPLPANTPFAHPHRVASRPAETQPNAALLALLFALFEDGVKSIEASCGLMSFQSVLESQFVQVPHHCIIPGALREGDLADLVAALAPREVRLGNLVDGCGRLVTPAAARAAYETAIQAYQAAGAANRLQFAGATGAD
jgi:hypothetical protein